MLWVSSALSALSMASPRGFLFCRANFIAYIPRKKIPAGSDQGGKVRLKGKGIPAKQPGDLYVVFDVKLPSAHSDAAKALYKRMSEEMPFNPRADP